MNIYKDETEMLIETKIKPNIKNIYTMRMQGLSDKHIADALGISVKKFEKLIGESEVLKDAYNSATEIFCAQLFDVVSRRALGTDGRTDKDGNYLPPDHNLAFKLLEKFDNRFTNKQEIKQTFSIEQVIKQISIKEDKGEE